MRNVEGSMKTTSLKLAKLARRLLAVLNKRTRIEDTFNHIYKTKVWGEYESVSGPGSTLEQTVVLRKELPSILNSIQATSLLDAPCGDYFWMKELSLDLELYIGVDIVEEVIEQNSRKYAAPGKQFMVRDITRDSLPRVDCILCRDCLDHLDFNHVFRALKNFRLSKAKYLLATSYTARTHNYNIDTGDFRPTNLQQPPFCFPPPIYLINEENTEEEGEWSDKSIGLWRIDDLPLL
jgi:hypothetical protein